MPGDLMCLLVSGATPMATSTVSKSPGAGVFMVDTGMTSGAKICWLQQRTKRKGGDAVKCENEMCASMCVGGAEVEMSSYIPVCLGCEG